jgi:hypothetical protein
MSLCTLPCPPPSTRPGFPSRAESRLAQQVTVGEEGGGWDCAGWAGDAVDKKRLAEVYGVGARTRPQGEQAVLQRDGLLLERNCGRSVGEELWQERGIEGARERRSCSCSAPQPQRKVAVGPAASRGVPGRVRVRGRAGTVQ